MLYGGKPNENYVETRVRIYELMKVKSSMPLPPDPDSVEQVINRSHLQTFTWLRCCETQIPHLSLQENGWAIDGDTVRPTWLTGSQLPPSAVRNRKNRQRKLEPGNVADDENNDIEDVSPPLKRRRRRVQMTNDEEPTSSSCKTTYENEAVDETDTQEVLVTDPTEFRVLTTGKRVIF